MHVLVFVAAAWLAVAIVVTAAFLGTRRSRRLYALFFGERPSAEIHQMAVVPSTSSDLPERMAA